MRLTGWLAVFGGLMGGAGASAAAQTIEVPAGQHVVLTAEGRGVQIYRCDPWQGIAAWTFVAPEAALYVKDTKVGVHGAGPMWTYKDGSVHGKVLTTVASTEPDAVPWLLLEATEASGTGLLTTVSYIERSETKGGKAVTTGCDVPHIGTVSRVPYTATYTFFAPRKDGAEPPPQP